MATPPVTTVDVRRLLRAHYGEGAYAVLEEVSDAAGFDRCRSADMIVMGLWPSRGLLLEGIEIKVSRADWIKELREPAKAETFARWCDRWWVATGDPSLIHPGELPDAWGHLSVSGGKIKVITPAPRYKDPQPLERGFLAALLKRATATPATVLDELVDAKVVERLDRKTSSLKWNSIHAKKALEDLQRVVRNFEQMSGMNIGWVNQEQIALFQLLQQASGLRIPGAGDVAQAFADVESRLSQALYGARKMREAYGPVLAQLQEQRLFEVPPVIPTSLIERNHNAPHATGHVFHLSQSDFEREQVMSPRGFFRIWEPPLLGAARTHGTKRRPSVRRAAEFIPAYRLELAHIHACEEDITVIYTESPAAEALWDIVVMLPEGWTPKLQGVRQLPFSQMIDKRMHQAWAVPIDTSVPLEHLGSWILRGEIPADASQLPE